jgi:hypothetical protein
MLKEMAAIAERASGNRVAVSTSIGGNLAEVSLIWQAESLALNEDALAKVMAEPAFLALVPKFAAVIVPNSGREQLYRHI